MSLTTQNINPSQLIKYTVHSRSPLSPSSHLISLLHAQTNNLNLPPQMINPLLQNRQFRQNSNEIRISTRNSDLFRNNDFLSIEMICFAADAFWFFEHCFLGHGKERCVFRFGQERGVFTEEGGFFAEEGGLLSEGEEGGVGGDAGGEGGWFRG